MKFCLRCSGRSRCFFSFRLLALSLPLEFKNARCNAEINILINFFSNLFQLFFLHLIAIYFFWAMLQKINKEKFAFSWLSKKGLVSIGAFHKHNKETKRHLTPVNKQSRLLKYILHCLHENDSSSQVLVVVLQCVLQCTYFIWASNVSLDFFFLINQFLKQWFTLFRCSIVKFDDCYKKYSKTSLSMLHTFQLQEHMYSSVNREKNVFFKNNFLLS